MVLLIIDTQVGITDERLYDFERFKENIKRLIAGAREKGTEVIFVRHDDGPGTGFSIGDYEWQIFPEFAPLPTEKIFEKKVHSALNRETGLLDYLLEKGEKTLVIAGLQTGFCIDATIKTAFDNGFEIIVPEHSTSTLHFEHISGEQAYNYYNKQVWPSQYARVLPVDEVIAEFGK